MAKGKVLLMDDEQIILDVTLDPPVTLREGAIPMHRIREKLLFTATAVRRLQS